MDQALRRREKVARPVDPYQSSGRLVSDTSPIQPLLLFDGECNLCTGSVRFVIKRDPDAIFTFASLQSQIGERLCEQYGIDPQKRDSMVLIDNDKAYVRSNAALRIAGKLRGPCRLAVVFYVVPRFIRDAVYRLIARNRYRWFGKRESCWLPTPELQKRFLGDKVFTSSFEGT